MNLPDLNSADVTGKRVMVRADLDFDPTDQNNLRLKSLVPTLDFLKSKNCQIILIGHRGRPEGKVDESLSLKPFEKIFENWGANVLENLRFDPGEEGNDMEFARKLSSQADFYVNEAFGVSHRAHASIVLLPKLLPHAVGFRFVLEIENLNKALENPRRPVISLISGVKEDKLTYIEPFKKFSDKLLISGRLPKFLEDAKPDEKVLIARLVPDNEDITIHSMELFEEEISKAGTIVLAGPIGKFEEIGHRQGTERVFKAIANSSAFKIAGGGDTTSAINMFALEDKFDWISVGGGAMLDFLANHTLPGIEALLQE